MFCWAQGSGKTLSAVNYVGKLMTMYPNCKLVTNLYLADYPIVTLKKFIEKHDYLKNNWIILKHSTYMKIRFFLLLIMMLFAGVSVVGIFVDLRMIKILVPFVLVILNLDKLIKFIMFIIKKIPFLGME